MKIQCTKRNIHMLLLVIASFVGNNTIEIKNENYFFKMKIEKMNKKVKLNKNRKIFHFYTFYSNSTFFIKFRNILQILVNFSYYLRKTTTEFDEKNITSLNCIRIFSLSLPHALF